MSILIYKTANNPKEYLDVCKSTFFEETKDRAFSTKEVIPFDSLDEWIDFFGAWELRYLDDDVDVDDVVRGFDGEIDLKPDESEYPVLVVFKFSEGEDRFGSMSNVIWDWAPLGKIIPSKI